MAERGASDADVIAEVAKRHGVLLDPHDPVLVERTVAEIDARDYRERQDRLLEREERTAAELRQILDQAKTIVATAERVANRPLLTDQQVRHVLVPGLVASVPWWLAVVGAVFLLIGAGGGYWYRGPGPVLVGVRAGTEKCDDRSDGSRLCWIPVYERLPAAMGGGNR